MGLGDNEDYIFMGMSALVDNTVVSDCDIGHHARATCYDIPVPSGVLPYVFFFFLCCFSSLKFTSGSALLLRLSPSSLAGLRS